MVQIDSIHVYTYVGMLSLSLSSFLESSAMVKLGTADLQKLLH